MAIKIKEVQQNEVHWILPWNPGSQANNKLTQMLGDYRVNFANLRVGGNCYVWDTGSDGWTSHAMAPSHIRREVDIRWSELCADVRTHLQGIPSKLAEDILTIPNADYIFYNRSDDGTISLLVTGWGFRNFMRQHQLETVWSKVGIVVTMDSQPLAGEQGWVGYHGEDFPVTTDAAGMATVSIDLVPDEECVARVRNQVQQVKLPAEGYVFRFDFVTPPPAPEPTPEPLPEEPQTPPAEPNMASETPPTVPESEGETSEVPGVVSGPDIPAEPDPEPVVVPKPPLKFRVVNGDGKPYSNGRVTFVQDGKAKTMILDGNGSCTMDGDTFTPSEDILLRLPDKPECDDIAFRLEEGENEYEFVEQFQTEKHYSLWKQILVLAAIILVIVAVAFVLFRFVI